MCYSLTKNHYIAPLHSCLMAKICNHTGIKRCGLEKDDQDKRLFLDDCDMFEYNCDYKKAYSGIYDNFCEESITQSNTENSKTSKRTTVNISLPTTTDYKHTTSNSTTLQITSTATTKTQTDPEVKTIPTESKTTVSATVAAKCTCMNSQTIPVSTTKPTQKITETVSTLAETKYCTCNSLNIETHELTTKTQPESATTTKPTTPMTPVSGTTNAKCTCTDLQTSPVSNTESTITSTQIQHKCTCTHSHSKPQSMRTVDTTSNKFETTTEHVSENPNVTESTTGSSYANISRVPIAAECTRGKQNSTSIVTSETISHSTDTVLTGETKCTCMNKEMPTSISHLETNITTTPGESTTLPISRPNTNTETVSTQKTCGCNSVSHETSDTITTQTEPYSEITIIPTKPMTPSSGITAAKCTCMGSQTTPVTTTESKIPSTQTQHECTCTNSPSEFSLITTIDDRTHNPLTKVDSLTTVKHTCDKYPKHCKRPHTWDTTARGETRDFFQILRERFGNRVKILKDTTHWPRRMANFFENNNDAFRFGTHHDI